MNKYVCLDKNTRARLMHAMCAIEHGRTPFHNGRQAPVGVSKEAGGRVEDTTTGGVSLLFLLKGALKSATPRHMRSPSAAPCSPSPAAAASSTP
eukprot:TRINITY_DN5451_c0_g1_i1.p2 TRINITY_DN5451_c0_g1~~TRINITY_DN5451_c0_g1_i1.p2  ORF type:complete len:106 (+),score=15.18 TRINITY_DN5451_c0_g1_i1:39-320(+)